MKNYPNIRAINIKKEVDLSNPTQHLSSISDKYWVDQIGDYTGEQYDKSIYSFNGNNSYIDTNQVAVSLVGEVSIYARVVSSGCLISNRTSSSNYFEVNLGSIGSPLVQVTLKESPNNYVLNSSTINTGDWHKIVVRYTGVKLFIYIDDVLDSTLSGLTNITSNSNNVLIGTNNNNGHVLEGEVADFTWKDLQGNILIHYKMEERSGNIAYNSAGTGVHGTLYNITHTPIRDPFLFNYTNEEGYNEDNGVILPKVEGFVKVEDYPWNWYTQGGNLLYKDNYYKPSNDGTLLQGDQTDYDSITTFDISNGNYTLDLTSTLLGKFQNLVSLSAEGNSIDSIDLTLNTNLGDLELKNCNFTSLDISNNLALTDLSISDNPISVLDISNNTLLSKLYAYNTQITSLDVSNNSLLSDIKVQNSNLDVTENNQLLITLDIFNTSNGFLESTIYGVGQVSPEAMTSYKSLLSRNWTIQGLEVTLNPGITYNIEDYPFVWINDAYYNTYKDNTFEVSTPTLFTSSLEYDNTTEVKLNNLSLNTDFNNNLLTKFPNLNTLELANNNISNIEVLNLNSLDNISIFNNSLDNVENSDIIIDLDNNGLTDGYLKTNISNGLSLTSLGETSYNNLFEKNWYMEFGSLLNLYPNAKAAYSLFLLDDNYTGPCINVRRSSDNTTIDIGFDGKDLDVTTLETFCQPNTITYQSDFSSTDDLFEGYGVGTPGQTIAGVNDAYKFECTSGLNIHQASKPGFDSNQSMTVTFDYYIPSTNAELNTLFVGFVSGTTELQPSITDTWTSVNVEITNSASGVLFFRGWSNSGQTFNADGDVFYLKNIQVTQLTADGYVTTWYDQSGNGYDAQQLTAAAQPKIVSLGSVILENSKPTISFDGVDDTILYDFSPDETQPFTLFYVRRYRNISGTYVGVGVDSTPNTGYAEIANGIQFRTYYGNYLVNGSSNTNQGLWYSLGNGANSEIGLDSATTITGNAGTNSLELLSIGSAGGSAFFAPINVQSIIIYNSNQSSNRVHIERILNNYYNIYPKGNRLLNYYRGAQAAYSLMLLDANHTGPAVNVRRGMDNATLDVGFVNNELDIAALEAFCQPNVIVYQLDASAGNENLQKIRGTATDGETIAGVSDCYKFTIDNQFGAHQAFQSGLEVGQTFTMTFDYYIPSTNTDLTGILVSRTNPGPTTVYDVTDQWTSVSVTLENDAFFRFFAHNGSTTNFTGNGTDVFYLKNIEINQLTTNGYVTQWYDQSGNGYDAVQLTASSQPQIVSNGSVLLKNGKPSIDFGGTAYLETVDTTVDWSIEQIQIVAYNDLQITSTSGIQQILKTYGAAGYEGLAFGSATSLLTNETFTMYLDTSARDAITNTIGIDLHLFTLDWDSTKHNIYLDGSAGSYISTGTSVQLNGRQLTIASRSGSFNFVGSVSCFVAYSSNQSANRIAIEENINSYYNIFPVEQTILSYYIQRVEADGGVVESQDYVLQTITDLNQ